jgi:arabinogalactan oligomer / maltooligosaccharide transport system permease protein
VRRSDLPIPALWILCVLGIWALFATVPEAVMRGRFLVVPWGWARVTGGLALGIVMVAGTAWLWGRSRRPMRARRYAITAGTHLFLWAAIATTFYPVIYLLAVSFNENDTLAGALPREGPLWVRAGILPDPAAISLEQYRKVLSATHVVPYQWIFVGLAAAALAGLIVVTLLARRQRLPAHRADQLRRTSGLVLFGALAALVVSIGPGQFYTVVDGQRVPAASDRTIVLFIRNTLLVSGMTGLFAVAISTTAGYAFARMRFEGRYQTLLTFVFVQMFPGFMALVAIYYLMSYLDLINTFTGLILAYSGGAIAFSAWIFKGYLESISPSLEEAARVDGATRWGAFVRIILPISVPMLLFIFLLQFINTYSEFILANTLLIGQENWTVGIGLRNFTTGRFDTQWGALAASAVLGSLPILAIFYSFQEALTGQYQSGGVKG